MPVTKLLVIDNFKPFRRFVCSLLRRAGRFDVLDMASDGSDAIRKAEQIQPDLVLIDLNLPKLSSIEVAQRIHELAPETKILFLSQEFSSDLIKEAFQAGALGYVQKILAGSELVPAVGTILDGRQFVSGRMTNKPLPATSQPFHHEVQFYFDEATLLQRLTAMTSNALLHGGSTIVIGIEKHLLSLERRLEPLGFDTTQAKTDGRFILLDATECLRQFFAGGMPTTTRFFETMGPLVVKASSSARADQPCVTVFGEMVALLWSAGYEQAAVRLEQLWNELAAKHNFSLTCAYPMTEAQKNAANNQLIISVCPEHNAAHSI